MKHFPTHIVAVFGIVENEQREVLLLKHREKDVWMFPGGQVETGENLINALIREAKEESNMDISVNKLYCISSNTCSYKGYNGYDMVPTKVIFGFTCTYNGGIFCDSEESTEACWVSKDKVLDYLSVSDSIDKYKAFLNFRGEIQYLEYITKPEYKLKFERLI